MPVVCLIRHAQATYGSDRDDALSELGRRQAALLDEALGRRHSRPQTVAAGTLRRQADTARACRLSVPDEPLVDARWDEFAAADVLAHHASMPPSDGPRNALGAPPSLTAREFQALLDDALAGWIAASERSPCAETWPAFQSRALAALSGLVARLNGGEEAWAFTSAGVIAATAAALLDAPSATFVALNRVSVNTGVTKIISGGAGARLLTFNDHSHLEHDRELMTFR
jgi:broad specificity phosphatase PhoE